MSILQQLMQNPKGMRLIDTDGMLSIGTIEPNSGAIQMQGGKKVNMVSPSAVLIEGGEGGATLKGQAGFVGTNLASSQNRKKASLFDKFKSLPPDVLMRAGGAMLGADDFTSGMQAAGNQYADYFKTQTPQAKLDRALDIYDRVNKINKLNRDANKKVNDQQQLIANFTSVGNQFTKMSDMLNQNPNAVGIGLATILRDATGIDIAGFGDDPKAGIRSQLQTLKISEQLLNAAKTKGAISNAEMTIFASDQPKFSYSNDQWQVWLKARQQAINDILRRLDAGEVVAISDRPSDEAIKNLVKQEDSWIDGLTGSLFSGSSKSTVNIQEFNDADAVLGIQ